MCSTCTVFNLRPYHDGQEHLQHGAHAEDPARLRQCTAYYTYSVSASERCEWVSRDVVVVCLGGKIRGWQLGSGRCARAARAERKAARRFKGKRDGRLSFPQGVDACFNWASQFRARVRRRLFVPRSGGADVGQCIKEVQQFTESNVCRTVLKPWRQVAQHFRATPFNKSNLGVGNAHAHLEREVFLDEGVELRPIPAQSRANTPPRVGKKHYHQKVDYRPLRFLCPLSLLLRDRRAVRFRAYRFDL